MEFSSQEYWSRLPFPSPGGLPYPGIEPASFASPALAGGCFTSWATREALDDPRFVGNVIIRSQSNTCLLLSISPDQNVDLSHVSVTELHQSLFDLVLVGLDLHNEYQCVVFCSLHGEGDLDDGIAVKFVSSRGALPRIFGLPPESQRFGLLEGGWHLDFFFVAEDAFQHCSLGLQSLCFGCGFGRGTGASFFTFSTVFVKSHKIFLKVKIIKT